MLMLIVRLFSEVRRRLALKPWPWKLGDSDSGISSSEGSAQLRRREGGGGRRAVSSEGRKGHRGKAEERQGGEGRTLRQSLSVGRGQGAVDRRQEGGRERQLEGGRGKGHTGRGKEGQGKNKDGNRVLQEKKEVQEVRRLESDVQERGGEGRRISRRISRRSIVNRSLGRTEDWMGGRVEEERREEKWKREEEGRMEEELRRGEKLRREEERRREEIIIGRREESIIGRRVDSHMSRRVTGSRSSSAYSLHPISAFCPERRSLQRIGSGFYRTSQVHPRRSEDSETRGHRLSPGQGESWLASSIGPRERWGLGEGYGEGRGQEKVQEGQWLRGQEEKRQWRVRGQEQERPEEGEWKGKGQDPVRHWWRDQERRVSLRRLTTMTSSHHLPRLTARTSLGSSLRSSSCSSLSQASSAKRPTSCTLSSSSSLSDREEEDISMAQICRSRVVHSYIASRGQREKEVEIYEHLPAYILLRPSCLKLSSVSVC